MLHILCSWFPTVSDRKPFINDYKRLHTDVNAYQPNNRSSEQHLCFVNLIQLHPFQPNKVEKKKKLVKGQGKGKQIKKQTHENNLQQCTTDRKSRKGS